MNAFVQAPKCFDVHVEGGWHRLIESANQAQRSGNHQSALWHLEKAINWAQSELCQYCPNNRQGIDHLVSAHQGLCRCLCSAQRHEDALSKLSELHSQLIALACDSQGNRGLRLDALAALDTSLFNLTALLNQLDRMEQLEWEVTRTAKAAEQSAGQLFSSASA